MNKLSGEEYINHESFGFIRSTLFGAIIVFESMFYGTPTVTLPSKFLRGKIVEGAYKQLKIDDAPIVKNIDDYVSLAIEIANTEPKKMLERKKYYADCADKNLFENKGALQSFQKILLNIVNN